LIEIGILYLLPDPVASHHCLLRRKIEEQFHLGGPTEFPIPAHIAMKYHSPSNNLEQLESVIQAYCHSQVKTPWSLQGFNYFENDDQFIIYVDVIPSQETHNAHVRLLDNLRKISWMQWGPFDHANLHYHVTLASKGVTRENFQAVWSFVQHQAYSKVELFFDNLALIQIVDGKHTVYKKYRLLDC
jgi:2'-5' RNA ligase